MSEISYSEDFVWYFVNHNAPLRLVDKRKDETIEKSEALKKFNAHWENGMHEAIQKAEDVTPEHSWQQLELDENYNVRKRKFFDRSARHREFRYEAMTFIVQMNASGVVNQIWFVPSRDYDPLKICVTFPTEESKQRFLSLSDSSDKYGNKLLEKIVKEYMAKHNQSWH